MDGPSSSSCAKASARPRTRSRTSRAKEMMPMLEAAAPSTPPPPRAGRLMAAAPILSGELGLLSLFDLGQLLMLNGGDRRPDHSPRRPQVVPLLRPRPDRGRARRFFVPRGRTGRIPDLHVQGRPVRVPHRRHREQPRHSRGHRGLMMEAARLMDEAGEANGDRQGRRKLARAAQTRSTRCARRSSSSRRRRARCPKRASLRSRCSRNVRRAAVPARPRAAAAAGRTLAQRRPPVLDAAAFDQLRTPVRRRVERGAVVRFERRDVRDHGRRPAALRSRA